MYMKGLSAVIAAIILLLISIALASFAFTFFARMPVKVSSAAEEEARQFVGDLTPFRIDTIDNGNLYIRNLDIKPIEGEHLALFVDNTLVNTSSNNLTLLIHNGGSVRDRWSLACTETARLNKGRKGTVADPACR